jgi:iron complex outermembrane receptor protein
MKALDPKTPSLASGLTVWVVTGALLLFCGIAPAQQAPQEEITVIGVAPLPGSGINPDKVPANTEILSSADLRRQGQASMIRTLNDDLASGGINDNLDDPFQPDFLYRGFTASPVLGTAQGLAVYQNGVRINEAFGDTVNWDLISDQAINRITLMNANPVFGLNALGGALNVEMKTGFTYQDGEAEISGGAFGQRSFSLQYGHQLGDWALYAAGHVLDSDGWRDFSPDAVRQLYLDLARREEKYTFDLSFAGANNLLQAVGATPAQELAISRSLVFTHPQGTRNQLEFGNFNGSYNPSDSLTIAANAYYREIRQTVVNGNTTDAVPCPNEPVLCDAGGNPLVGLDGKPIPDISRGGTVPIGENDNDATRTVGEGGSIQAAYTGDLFGHHNHFVAAAAIDRAGTDYQAASEIGVIDNTLLVESSGYFVYAPDTAAGPVRLHTGNEYDGFYATDTLDLTDAVSVTASARYNIARIKLSDRLGTALDGDAQYRRFNPAIGTTYKLTPDVTAYAGYSETNRAPTAGEIACSNPLSPCILPAFLSSDPPGLRQVVAHSYEAGLRGAFALPDLAPGRFTWKLGAYRTDLDDDIIAVTSALSINQGYYQNAGNTRRQGIEAGITYRDESWTIFLNYSLVDATFQSALQLPSAAPSADANGNIHVRPGDVLPGVPENRLKLGVDYRITSDWTVGGTLNVVSSQYYANDQSNQNPPLPGHAVVNVHTNYAIGDQAELFGEIDNVFDTRYATYGIFGDPTGIGAPGIPTNGAPVDPRFISPAPPIGVVAGVRLKL